MGNTPAAQLTTQSPSGAEALLEALSAGWTQGQNGHPCKRQKKEVDPGIDYLINAKNRSAVMCQRKVFDVCFDNDTASKHDFDLVNTLDDWREAKTTTVFGWASLNDHGPSLVMPNTTLDRIVNCAHHRKIHTAQDLKRETGWTDTERFSMEIVAIIQRHAPPLPSPFVSTPLRPTSSNNISITSRLRPPTPTSPISHTIHSLNIPKQRNKCSACGHEGHNGMYA
ncbi:hypothetical protein PAXINDRAFT_86935 [Paxillus involutus ATCC 200175]|uniref:Uncharacterized protein n=1 Tax=Paxillus involutus ATCC 200175 TaxID=664439 RepID=A0A0C9SQQ8_PAXIN|nr:hypothetical protein PAXINDRAFT_86935 [Paxillus involutus ATCC 200175]